MGCCDTPGLMPIDTAISKMLESITPISLVTNLPLDKAVGYVLSEDIHSPINVPPFDNSAMDGYALRSSDLESTTQLPLIGKSFAGIPFEGDWPQGTCIRIMTGAQIPQGCDLVIMQEQAEANGDLVNFSQALPVKLQQNIRPTGDDIEQGALVLAKGHKLTSRDIPMIATLGIPSVSVFQKPKVAFFSTGDELKPLGTKLKAGEIYDSNRYGIKVMLEKFGCEAIDLGVIPDDKEQLRQAFQQAQSQADVVITSGGVSVGEADYTKEILDELGEIGFWKIAMKPGKPFAFGKLLETEERKSALFCGLPGNPVSAVLTLYILVQPLLAKLAGHSQWQPQPSIPAVSQTRFKKVPGRTDFQRGIFSITEQGTLEVSTTGNQSSGAFRSMSLANCFVVLEQERGHVEAGETVHIQMFSPSFY
ncbi:molybdopterin molybdotransferase MoeA [Vibrio algivorus]|uniref:Molybdopterin molybdenumtransferase n=1 Tax=Vibrio algivorus TaxID=1667024 RepID=A0A557PFD7_9VIBR|nr:molybdopterin molybdotransferase MoeA [Vibrio algivorus]TVO39353.1 molybdopterin molybdotransferase MoeA [Vibrio algivorus]GLT14511.1 molybdopterin molybdenumtransferase MoeA [Vibrio algivorus]